jgi:hypothetical protein
MVSAAPPTAPSQTLPEQASTRVRYDSGREKWKAERLLPNRRFLGYFPTEKAAAAACAQFVSRADVKRAAVNEAGTAHRSGAAAAATGGRGSPEPEPEPGEQRPSCVYAATADRANPHWANPKHRQNIDLHRARFRQQNPAGADQRTEEQYADMHARKDWAADHLHLIRDMRVVRLHITAAVQRTLHAMQTRLVDHPYAQFGRTEKSWGGYTLMYLLLTTHLPTY